MSLLMYTTSGSLGLQRPTVLRRYVPNRTPRQVRYTRSLSTPLSLDSIYMPTSKLSSLALGLDFANEPRSRASILTRSSILSPPPRVSTVTRSSISPPSVFTPTISSIPSPSVSTLTRSDISPPSRSRLTRSIIYKPLESTSFWRLDKIPRLPTTIPETARLWRKTETQSAIDHVSSKLSRSTRWWRREKPLCTPDDLLDIIREPVGYYALPTDPCNEVYPGIYLSDGATALCTSLLKKMGVTHVLNAAQGKEKPNQVNTGSGFYSHSKIQFLGVEALDNIGFRLYPYFQEASDFIQDALESDGKVLVHCRVGISRSATLVCAYLMIKRRLSAQEAVRTVREHRAIIPNEGFLQQLCDLNDRLYKK